MACVRIGDLRGGGRKVLVNVDGVRSRCHQAQRHSSASRRKRPAASKPREGLQWRCPSWMLVSSSAKGAPESRLRRLRMRFAAWRDRSSSAAAGAGRAVTWAGGLESECVMACVRGGCIHTRSLSRTSLMSSLLGAGWRPPLACPVRPPNSQSLQGGHRVPSCGAQSRSVPHDGGGQTAAGFPMPFSNWPKEVVSLRKDRDLLQASERQNRALNAAWCCVAL